MTSEIDRLRNVRETSQNSLHEVETTIKDKQVELFDKKSQVADLNEKYTNEIIKKAETISKQERIENMCFGYHSAKQV